MRAWLLDQYTGLDHLRLAEVPDPPPGAGEVVLDLDFAALNPADRYLSQGEYPARPPLPHILGRDGVGTVSALGPGADQFKIGQRLLILRGDTGVYRWGTFAQRVAVAMDSLVVPPDGWTLEQAAGAPLVYLTAYQALTQWGDLPPSVVLITGASGGVGVATIQLCKAIGHSVVALSRGSTKQQQLLEVGADDVVDPTEADWPKKLLKLLSNRRVDLAIDNIGGPLLPQVIETMGNHGRISLVGRLAGPVPQFNTAALFFRRLKMGGVAVGTYSRPEAHAAWQAVVDLLAKSNAKPLVDRVFPFEQLPQAFERLAAGPMGKILLKIGS
jgi:NADPH2:quinone reductase